MENIAQGANTIIFMIITLVGFFILLISLVL